MAPSSRSRRFPFFEAPKKQGPEKNGEEAGRLRVGEAEKRFRIDADELDQKPRGSGEDQVVAENLAARFRPAQRLCSHAPEKRGDRHPDEEFVDRRGMPALRRGHNAIREAHAPGQQRWYAIIAVAGKQAADAPDGVARRRSGRASVQELEDGQLRPARENQERGQAAEESTEPCKPEPADEPGPRVREELAGALERMIEPRADDSGNSGDDNHPEGVRGQPATVEVGLQDVSRKEQAGGYHQAKRGNDQRVKMKIRVHESAASRCPRSVHEGRPATRAGLPLSGAAAPILSG